MDRRAGCQDTSIVGADVPVEDRRDVRREAGDSLVGHSSEKLGAYRLTPRIDWLIVGGESGLKARSCHVEWIRSVVKQCQGAGVPCFVKQLGAVISDDNADEWPNPRSLASPMWQYPDGLVRRATLSLKGNDPAEWPESLRVREWPEVRA
ncbi:MAG TPA: hypothetical protein DCQ64_19850 [Candidatus Rokubacteria bacterium]|nr:hypothetical protein [Candidatus Rokubacteria bacterium]